MNNYRYTLEPYNGMKTRYNCPNCNKQGVFTRYIDTQAQEYINDAVGICNRLVKCGYHYTPKQYFDDNNISFMGKPSTPRRTIEPKPKTSFIDLEVMQKSKTSRSPNYFIDYLASLWDYEVAYYLADTYNIGASNHWQGATVFWQVDKDNNVRSGKIMLYDASSGKRVKEPYNHINWVHEVLKLDNFNLEQCYFGEHLLNEDTKKPVAIVESEKTAIISSVYLPEFIWLACGSVNNLNEAKTRVLKGRNVVLFPDLKCYDLWNGKIPQLTSLATFRTSTLLETKATEDEKNIGLDIADYLIKLDWRLFRNRHIQEQPPQPEPEKVTKVEVIKTERIEQPPEDVELWFKAGEPFLMYKFNWIDFKEIGYHHWDWVPRKSEIKEKVKMMFN